MHAFDCSEALSNPDREGLKVQRQRNASGLYPRARIDLDVVLGLELNEALCMVDRDPMSNMWREAQDFGHQIIGQAGLAIRRNHGIQITCADLVEVLELQNCLNRGESPKKPIPETLESLVLARAIGELVRIDDPGASPSAVGANDAQDLLEARRHRGRAGLLGGYWRAHQGEGLHARIWVASLPQGVLNFREVLRDLPHWVMAYLC